MTHEEFLKTLEEIGRPIDKYGYDSILSSLAMMSYSQAKEARADGYEAIAEHYTEIANKISDTLYKIGYLE